MRRKRRLAPQEASPSSAVDRTEKLYNLSLQKVGDTAATIHVALYSPHKQQKTNDALVSQDVEMRFSTDFLSLTKETRQPLFPQLNQFLVPGSRDHLVGTSTLDIASEASSVHLYCLQNSLALRERVIRLAKEMKRLDDVAKNSEAKTKTATRQFLTMNKEFDEASKKVDELESRLEGQSKKMEEQAQQLKDQPQQLDNKAVVIQDRDEALSKVDVELSSVKKEIDDALDESAELEIKLRAQLMKEYLDGKAREWRPQEDINRFLASEGTLAELGEDAAIVSIAES